MHTILAMEKFQDTILAIKIPRHSILEHLPY
jgi:hypothetical protein